MARFDSSDTRINAAVPTPPTRRRFDLGRPRRADLYDAWTFAETDASLALEAWRSAARSDKADAHAAYRAALDREEHAAVVLEHRLSPGR